MEMDAQTRRQADKLESVLTDLVRDLATLASLPMDLRPCVRRDCLEAAPHLLSDPNWDEEEDDLSDVLCALALRPLFAPLSASIDPDANAALRPIAQLAEAEAALAESAARLGAVDPQELRRQRALCRAALDTLRAGGYGAGGELPPAAAHIAGGATVYGALAARRRLDPGVAALREVVAALTALTAARNRTTVNDDVHNYRILHEAVNKEKTTSADVKALKREYHETREARRTEVAALDAEIRQLEEEIDYTRSVAAMELAAFTEVNEKLREERRAAGEDQLAQCRTAAQQLEERLVALVARHQEEANGLRTQRAKKETAVSAAITEYDAQMTALKAATNALNKEAEEDTERIVDLERELEILYTEKGRYELEQKIQFMQEQHYQIMDEKREEDARTIQAYFRSYLARVRFVKAQGGGKKKRKGKSKNR